MQRSSEALKKCQAKKCSKELQQVQKQKDSMLKEVISLTKDYMGKKITVAQYKKKTDALKKKSVESTTTKNLSKCAFAKCNKETKQMAKDLGNIMRVECKKGNKGACVIEKKASNVKSFSDYQAFVKSLVV